MKKSLSHLTYTAFLFVACVSMVGCSTLYEPDTTGTPGTVKPRSSITTVVDTAGGIAGPWGQLAASGLNLLLAGGAMVLNQKTKKALADHIEASAPAK